MCATQPPLFPSGGRWFYTQKLLTLGQARREGGQKDFQKDRSGIGFPPLRREERGGGGAIQVVVNLKHITINLIRVVINLMQVAIHVMQVVINLIQLVINLIHGVTNVI